MHKDRSTVKLELGRVVGTASVYAAASEGFEVATYLDQHRIGRWGNVSLEDRASNDVALITGDRIVSGYDTEKGRLMIITEGDRKVTTVMFSEEY